MNPMLKPLGLSLLRQQWAVGMPGTSATGTRRDPGRGPGRMTQGGSTLPVVANRNDRSLHKDREPVVLGGSPALSRGAWGDPGPAGRGPDLTVSARGSAFRVGVAALWYHGKRMPVKWDSGLKPLKRSRFIPSVNAWASTPKGEKS
jgi:hypothetical protein